MNSNTSKELNHLYSIKSQGFITQEEFQILERYILQNDRKTTQKKRNSFIKLKDMKVALIAILIGFVFILSYKLFEETLNKIGNQSLTEMDSPNGNSNNSESGSSKDYLRSKVDDGKIYWKEFKQGKIYYLKFSSESSGWFGAVSLVFPSGCEAIYGYNYEEGNLTLSYAETTCNSCSDCRYLKRMKVKSGGISFSFNGATLDFKPFGL